MSPNSDILLCPHGERCGGCAYLGVPYSEQLDRKQAAVQRAFAGYPELAALQSSPVQGAEPAAAYRIRAKLVVDADRAVGLFSRDSHAVVDIPECRVVAPALSRAAQGLRQVLREVPASLDGVDLRLVDAGVLVTLIARRGTPHAELLHLASALSAACPEVVGIAASFRAADSNTLLGTGHVILVGNELEPHRPSPLAPYHLVAHGAFAQVHAGQAESAYSAIERALAERGAKRVVELYAGSGSLALRLAARGLDVTAVESYAPAITQLERAAREQGLRVQTRVAPAERVLQELLRTPENVDAVVVNPPRRGLAREVRRALCASHVQTLVYMSCDPATLARDVAHLGLAGFRAQGVHPFDMIPQSDAVECLLIAARSTPQLPHVLHETTDLVAVVKSGYETLTPELGQQSLLERVRLLPGCSAAEPAQLLDREASGVCVFAKSRAALPRVQNALADGKQEYRGLARGVTHKKGRIKRTVKQHGKPATSETLYRRNPARSSHSDLTLEPNLRAPERMRKHLASVGHPLLGDAAYGDEASNDFYLHRYGLDRSFLHCSRVTLTLPEGPLLLEAPLAGDLAAALQGTSEKTAPRGQ